MDEVRISLAAARRIALSAQGFGNRPASPPGLARVTTEVRRLGVLQLDSVNVVTRAHYVPLFARLGPYETSLLDRISGHGPGPIDRRLVEYWAHEASLVPVEMHPWFRWRMDGVEREAWGSIRRVIQEQPQLVAEVLSLVSERGPVRARDTGFSRGTPRPGHMWNWHAGKVALEYLFFTGQVCAARRINFERLYDLSERVIPPAVAAVEISPRDAQRELVRVAAAALGVATAADLADYFRMGLTPTRARVAELVADGELRPTRVEGSHETWFLWTAARRPRQMNARALMSPFDSLVWFRPRTERLWDFRYRIEIYTPAEKRVYGYYVLPFLLGDRLVARVDLKSDREAGVLRVRGAFAEPGVDRVHVAGELAAELALAAGWLGLGGVVVEDRGDLAAELGSSCRAPGF